MLVSWHESRYKINYSHFFRGGWCGVLQLCNVWAHNFYFISACTIDFQPTLTYQSTSADLQQQCLTSFCAVWCIISLQKGKHCGVCRGEGCNAHDTQLSDCMQPFVTKLGIVVHHHEPQCHVKKWDSIFKVKVTVWAYINKIWQFLVYLLLVLNHSVFCNQTQFECRSS